MMLDRFDKADAIDVDCDIMMNNPSTFFQEIFLTFFRKVHCLFIIDSYLLKGCDFLQSKLDYGRQEFFSFLYFVDLVSSDTFF